MRYGRIVDRNLRVRHIQFGIRFDQDDWLDSEAVRRSRAEHRDVPRSELVREAIDMLIASLKRPKSI